MKTITLEDFNRNTIEFVKNAAANDDFVKIKTPIGTAVLISDAEWNIALDALKMALQQ